MEGLIEFVDAFFARHGIACPAGDSQFARSNSDQPVRPAEPALTTALPAHNYQESSPGRGEPT